MVAGKRGLTDEGLAYVVLRGADTPPIVLSVAPGDRSHWNERKAAAVVGQQFGIKHEGRALMLRVIAAVVNPRTRCLELTCR